METFNWGEYFGGVLIAIVTLLAVGVLVRWLAIRDTKKAKEEMEDHSKCILRYWREQEKQRKADK